MVSAETRLGTAFTLGEQRTRFPVPGRTFTASALWALMPDERRFIFISYVGLTAAASTVPVEVIRVDNWLQGERQAAVKRS
jgi:hypothetical protein